MTCKNLTFDECELAILKASIQQLEEIQGKEFMNLAETKKIKTIVKKFIQDSKGLLYGGTAINDMLPKEAQFYEYEYEFPDYDMFTPHALENAKKLAQIFVDEGFFDVEAKAGVHHGTYKVYVNKLAVIDITFLHEELYRAMCKHGKKINGIMYSPINFLKQACYLELSRPKGDITRWEKVYKRLNLLNKYYPMNYHCKKLPPTKCSLPFCKDAMSIVKKTLLREDVVFIGAFADDFYGGTYDKHLYQYSVISLHADDTCKALMKSLKDFSPVLKVHEPIGELILEHYSIHIQNVPFAFIFKPVACHSYNVIKHQNTNIKIGTIDTLFSYYLAFIYADRDYLDENSILCSANNLFKLQEKRRLTKGIFRRFNINCYGVQTGLKELFDEKQKMHETLKPNTKKYEEWFLKFTPKTKKTKKSKKKLYIKE